MRSVYKVLLLFYMCAEKTVDEGELVEHFDLSKKRAKMCQYQELTDIPKRSESTLLISNTKGIRRRVRNSPGNSVGYHNGFPSVKHEQDYVAFLKENDIFLANVNIREKHRTLIILVGLDYDHDVVINQGTEILYSTHRQNGFWSYNPRCGLTSVNQHKSVNYNLTAVCEKSEHHLPERESEPPLCRVYGFTIFPQLESKEVATAFQTNFRYS